MVPAEARLREVFNLLERHIEERYGIPVLVRDVPNPFSGDLDGSEIHVDYAEDVESALFIIAHLFGHTVQWNTSAAARELGSSVASNPSEELLQRLHEYELEACRYSMQLFQEAGINDLDQWLSDYSACDSAYLVDFYRTNQKKDFRSFWRAGAPLISAKPIPEFHPTKWVSRWAGIVV
jgi:hypothetical protein